MRAALEQQRLEVPARRARPARGPPAPPRSGRWPRSRPRPPRGAPPPRSATRPGKPPRSPAPRARPATSRLATGRRASESNTTRRGWRATPSMRAVSCGSSASAVPMPTATASDSARQRCARARLASPEIHWESPVRVATLPSSVMADLKHHERAPGARVLAEGLVEHPGGGSQIRAVQQVDLHPARREGSRGRGRRLRRGVVGGDHHAGDARLEDRVRARRGAPVCGSRARATRRAWPRRDPPSRRRARRAPRASSPGPTWKPSPMTLPSFTTTAPTSGLGLVCPRAAEASSMLRRRWRSSRSVAVVSGISRRP